MFYGNKDVILHCMYIVRTIHGVEQDNSGTIWAGFSLNKTIPVFVLTDELTCMQLTVIHCISKLFVSKEGSLYIFIICDEKKLFTLEE